MIVEPKRTFHSLEFAADGRADNEISDVAIIGIPYDLGAAERPGARFGPRAIRDASYWRGKAFSEQTSIFDELVVVDAGDIVPTPASPAISFRTIEEDLRHLLEGTRTPILLGGDHSILIPAMEALVAKHGPLNLVCFDSHADIGTTTDPNVHTHGVTLRRLLEANRTSRVFHIGMRGFGPPPRALEWMRLKAVSWWKMQEIDDIGLDTVLSSIIAQCRGKSYITLDIDVLDPAFAPGTGTPEPGGLTTRELLRAIRCLSSELDVVGFDVVEVSPPYDISEITAAAANRSIMEFLGGTAARKVEQWSDTGPEEVKTPNQP